MPPSIYPHYRSAPSCRRSPGPSRASTVNYEPLSGSIPASSDHGWRRRHLRSNRLCQLHRLQPSPPSAMPRSPDSPPALFRRSGMIEPITPIWIRHRSWSDSTRPIIYSTRFKLFSPFFTIFARYISRYLIVLRMHITEYLFYRVLR